MLFLHFFLPPRAMFFPPFTQSLNFAREEKRREGGRGPN
jgi:hypothetical protein